MTINIFTELIKLNIFCVIYKLTVLNKEIPVHVKKKKKEKEWIQWEINACVISIYVDDS